MLRFSENVFVFQHQELSVVLMNAYVVYTGNVHCILVLMCLWQGITNTDTSIGQKYCT